MNIELNQILAKENIEMSIDHIVQKRGAPGYDKMQPEELPAYWAKYGERIKETIQNGSYVPRPISIHYIPKADKTKKRKLGIPCIIDRMLLYAIQSVMTPYFEEEFSDRSYAFRKGKGCHDALFACLLELNRGAEYVVDLDIKSFFDKVNHTLLFELLDKKIEDPYLLLLLKKYIRTKAVCGKTFYINRIGLPQGTAISPILANMFLNSFDKHLEKMEIRFVRYADDIVIFCHSKEDAHYLLSDAESYLRYKLKLRLNQEKTKIVRPWELEYLGYSFSAASKGNMFFSLGEKTKHHMLDQMDELIRKKDLPASEWWGKIGGFNRGWINYYQHVDVFCLLKFLHSAQYHQAETIRQTIMEDTEKGSQTYFSALYENTDFSTLAGWYRKNLKKLKDLKKIERMKKIMNDVREWRSDKNFTETEQLKKQYSSLLERPFYYENKTGISLQSQKAKPILPETEERINELQKTIITILATGKNMTSAQIRAYLILCGKSEPAAEIDKQVNELVDKGIVERNQLCPKDIKTIQDKKLKIQYVNCYRLCFGAEEYVKSVNAPYDYEIDPNILAGGFGGLIYYYSTTILWNQIILNHFANNNPVKYFRISDYIITPTFQTIQIPLYIETDSGNYFFEYIHNISPVQLHYRFLRWAQLQKMVKKNITFVVVSKSEYNLYKAKYWLRQETLQSSCLFIHNIAFTVTRSWFLQQPGKLLTYTDIL